MCACHMYVCMHVCLYTCVCMQQVMYHSMYCVCTIVAHFPLNLSRAAIPNMNILLLGGFFRASSTHFNPILNIMYLCIHYIYYPSIAPKFANKN